MDDEETNWFMSFLYALNKYLPGVVEQGEGISALSGSSSIRIQKYQFL